MIYLDNAATTFPKPEEVYDALDYANRNLAFNAGRGSYKESVELVEMIENCRKAIGSLVRESSENIIFTSSATESLNLIINGLPLEDGDNVYVSPFEHNSIIRPLYNVNKRINIIVLPFNKKTWEPNYQKIEEMFSVNRPKAVFLSQVSNVTGLELDYQGIFEISKGFGSFTILDSAQAFGVINPILKNVDFCVFAGHKTLYASFGIAGFIDKSDYKLNLTKTGGNGSDSLNHSMPESGHERYEAGSPNVIAIYGLLKSIDWIKKQNIIQKEQELTDYLIKSLEKNKKVKLYLPESKKSAGIVSFNVEGYSSDDVASILYEEYKIMVRSGYHCSPFVHEFIGSLEFKGTVRVSFGAFNTKEEVDVLINALNTLWGDENEFTWYWY